MTSMGKCRGLRCARVGGLCVRVDQRSKECVSKIVAVVREREFVAHSLEVKVAKHVLQLFLPLHTGIVEFKLLQPSL